MVVASMVVGVGAHAAPTPAAARSDAIELVAQDPWTPVGGDLRLGLRVAASVEPEATVHIAAFETLSSRTEFDRVAIDGPRGPALDEIEVPIASLPADASGTRVVTLGLASPQPRDPARLGLRRAGVYPLVVELRTPGTTESLGTSFTTFAVVAPATPTGAAEPLARRLGVAWIWPLQEGPSILPDGSADPDVVRSFRADGRLGRQAAALTRAGDVPLTLVPGAETLAAWIEQGRDDPAIARGAAAIQDAAGRSQVLASTYVPSNLPVLLGAGLDALVDRQLADGLARGTPLLPHTPDGTTALVDPIDDASLARMHARGVQQMIVASSALESRDAKFTLAAPFELAYDDRGVSGTVRALASDSGLVSILSGSGSPALRAQSLLAGLSLIALEQPSVQRAVTLAIPRELDAPTALFDAALAGLRGNPWLDPITSTDAFGAGLPPGVDPVRLSVPEFVPDPPVPADAYRLTEARLDAFEAVVGGEDPIVTQGREALLIAESSTFLGADGLARARATVDHVNASMDAFLAGIRIPDPGTITLTSRAGEIPLTFRNDTGRKVRITVTLDSPKLFFPEGSTRTIELAPRNTTLRVAVEARTSGTFPLEMSVRTAQGGLVISESRFQVRSTVVSAVGLTLMIGAAAFLAIWWGLYIWRARRRRREAVGHG